MSSVLCINVGELGQFRVLIPPGGEVQDLEEARAIEAEITPRIRGSVQELAEHRFTGDIHVIGRVDKIRESVADVMQNWARYFRESPEWNRLGFRAATAYATRREIRVQFRSSHPASKFTRPRFSKLSREIHLRTKISGRLVVCGEKNGRTKLRQQHIREIKTLYQTRLFSLLTSKGLGIDVKGKLEDIQKGLVDKAIAQLLLLDVSNDRVKQDLSELEQKASQSYPSLQVQFFHLHPTPSPQQSPENLLPIVPSPTLAAGSSEELLLRASPPGLSATASLLPPLAAQPLLIIPSDAIGELPQEEISL